MDERRRDRDALQLAARQRVRAPVQQPGDPERQRDLLDGPRDGGRRHAVMLER
jgi:hypothetical protein